MNLFSALTTSAFLMLTAATIPAHATIITYNVALSGAQAVFANASTATGTATVTVDDVANTVAVSMTWTGLTGGSASAAHIHCCVPTTANGPVVIPFTAFPVATSGTYSNTFTGVNPANIAGIEAGLAYINIHNAGFPGGEIRGDIVTPEPASFGMAGLGIVVSLAGRARRNRWRLR